MLVGITTIEIGHGSKARTQRKTPASDLSWNPPPLPTQSSGSERASNNNNFPFEALAPMPLLPEAATVPTPEFPYELTAHCTGNGEAARPSLSGGKRSTPGDVSPPTLWRSLLLGLSLVAPREDNPPPHASPTVTGGVLSRRCIRPLGSSRAARHFPRLRLSSSAPAEPRDDGGVLLCFPRDLGGSSPPWSLRRRDGRLRRCTQLLEPGRLCIEARRDPDGEEWGRCS